jgi:PAS domain S-box-containing protein
MNPLPPPAASPDEELRLKRTLVHAFLENIPDVVYFKDRQSRFIAVSKSKADRHGCADPSGLIGRTDGDFFSTVHAAAARQDEEAIMATGVPIVGKVEKLTWADGRVSWARSSKLPLRDDRGQIIGTFGMSQDITAAKQMEEALETAHRDLTDASRVAGMAEVATGVLHNVGNVLNSLNVSAEVIGSSLRQAKSDSLAQVAKLLQDHAGDLGEFLTRDPKGRLVPEFLATYARHQEEERARLREEITSLQQHIDHIKEIVTMQQAYATMAGVVEPLAAAALMEDSLRMNSAGLARHEVRVVREFQPVPLVTAERGKVLQILVNLIRNAKYALDAGTAAEKTVWLRLEAAAPGKVRFIVRDNGVGIPEENLVRIFAHGFTTRADGHGFGLHSSILAAKEMHGDLTVHSEGPGQGATFTLELPSA